MSGVLVVEDDPDLAVLVAEYLRRDGHEVTSSGDGLRALELARSLRPDVVVLDLGLPGLDGIELCRRLRTFSDCYVLMLTARADEVDTLVGLSVGADDYLTKPFSPRELVARVRVLLRRPRSADAASGDEAVVGDVRVDFEGREVRQGGAVVDLTRTEFDVLAALARRPQRAFSRRQLVDEVWGPDWVGDQHLVDVHVAAIRRKLGDDPAEGRYVRTVRGVGYRLGAGG